MTKIQEKIIELRKDLREEYERIGNNFYLVMKDMDDFLERLYVGIKGNNIDEAKQKEVENEQQESKY